MWTLVTALPLLTAVLSVGCVVRPGSGRLIVPVLGLAVLNLVLTPLTSGEWFYQRAEIPGYDEAVAHGDFSAYRDLVGRHDPHLLPRMIGAAGALFATLALWAVLQRRSRHGRPASATVSAIAGGAVLLAAAAMLIGVYVVVTQGGPQGL